MITPAAQTFRFTCEYNGAAYCGFQRQKNGRSVQQLLEEALSKYFGTKTVLSASGRTDAGVHAQNQVCSFKIPVQNADSKNTPSAKDLHKIAAAVNAFLPADIAVRDFKPAPESFHAQFSAKSKTYIYRCFISPHRSPLRAATHLQAFKPLDTEAMKTAAKILEGTHNFKAFCSEQTDKTDFVRTLHECKVTQIGDELTFTVKGSGFLRNMVRIIVGTLIEVGQNKITPAQFAQILKSQSRANASQTAPAHGLTLLSVDY